MARVLTIDLKVINDTVGGNDVVIFWTEGAASALDTSTIPAGREVGAAVAYARLLDSQVLDFAFKDGKILDTQTGSEWNIFGIAIAGELQGKQLTPPKALAFSTPDTRAKIAWEHALYAEYIQRPETGGGRNAGASSKCVRRSNAACCCRSASRWCTFS